MASPKIAAPENFQLQSPLLRLPGEIRNIIWRFSFTTDEPIVDPAISASKSSHHSIPLLGVSLLQTCRLLYHEVDRRPLFTNTFRFTSVDRIRTFLNRLKPEENAMVYDIEVDVCKVHCNHPAITREWLHYLKWGGGYWAKIIGSLRMDAPNLRVLRLNFEAWPTILMFRPGLWDLLRSLLINVTGLERVVVTGASKGGAMAKREPWSPAHFVGGDDVEPHDLIQCMWKTVGEPDSLNKIIRWHRRDGKIGLEVISKTCSSYYGGNAWTETEVHRICTDPWPENGWCNWFAYEHRHQGVEVKVQTKPISPSASE